MPRSVTILGSTGSIGRSALEVIRHYRDRFRIRALAVHANVDLLAQQIDEFQPECVAVADEPAGNRLRAMRPEVDARVGGLAIEEVASLAADVTLCAIVGAAGLLPALRAIDAGNCIALANKEPLVMGGAVLMERAKARGVPVIPVDSEHNAIFQCLQGHRIEEVHRILLTASGGPFYRRRREELGAVTPEQAANHPTWDMGVKISVDSATLMNKGLEVIEAMWLFGVPAERIDVVIHPQSVIHSMVEFLDGGILAHLGVTDMKLPILFALAWPERAPLPMGRLDLTRLAPLTFAAPDYEQFPCLAHAFRAARAGGTATAILNGANEAAVEAFRAGRLTFLGISDVVGHALDTCPAGPATTIEAVLAADRMARACAERFINSTENPLYAG